MFILKTLPPEQSPAAMPGFFYSVGLGIKKATHHQQITTSILKNLKPFFEKQYILLSACGID
jgi:hypothetical protein